MKIDMDFDHLALEYMILIQVMFFTLALVAVGILYKALHFLQSTDIVKYVALLKYLANGSFFLIVIC